MELIMAEHRRTAHSRKAAARKTASKRTRKTTVRKAGSARGKSSPKKASPKRWSQRVTRESDALDLKHGVFKQTNARGIAQALGGTKFTPQGRRLSLGALDADLLYQPRRQDVAKNATRPAAARQGGVEATVSSRRIDRHTRENGYPAIADLHESRTVTEYLIIRFRG
jgi:hypothetical protein